MSAVDISDLSESQLEQIYAWPEIRTIRLNLVLSPTGSIAGLDGTSQSLTSQEDRRILRIIRKDADVVIIGGESVRKEGWFLPPQGKLFILSSSGNLPWENCPDPTKVSVFPTLTALLHNLAAKDERILCEGGMKTAELLASHWGFDEIALSFAESSQVQQIPASLSTGNYFDLVSELISPAEKMTFGFWRRGN